MLTFIDPSIHLFVSYYLSSFMQLSIHSFIYPAIHPSFRSWSVIIPLIYNNNSYRVFIVWLFPSDWSNPKRTINPSSGWLAASRPIETFVCCTIKNCRYSGNFKFWQLGYVCLCVIVCAVCVSVSVCVIVCAVCVSVSVCVLVYAVSVYTSVCCVLVYVCTKLCCVLVYVCVY